MEAQIQRPHQFSVCSPSPRRGGATAIPASVPSSPRRGWAVTLAAAETTACPTQGPGSSPRPQTAPTMSMSSTYSADDAGESGQKPSNVCRPVTSNTITMRRGSDGSIPLRASSTLCSTSGRIMDAGALQSSLGRLHGKAIPANITLASHHPTHIPSRPSPPRRGSSAIAPSPRRHSPFQLDQSELKASLGGIFSTRAATSSSSTLPSSSSTTRLGASPLRATSGNSGRGLQNARASTAGTHRNAQNGVGGILGSTYISSKAKSVEDLAIITCQRISPVSNNFRTR